MKKILITGGLGRIGKEIVPLLKSSFDITIFESPTKKNKKNENTVYGNILNQGDLKKVLRGMDAVVHLAAISDEDDFLTKIMPVNIAGVYNLFEAAKSCNVNKVIYASTFQTIWNYPNNEKITTEMPARPFNMYACSKLFGENVAKFYSEKFGMSTICLRIGYFLPYDHDWLKDTEKRKSWCSPKDLTQIITKSINNEKLKYEIFFALSENEGSFLDIENIKEKLDYVPEDGYGKVKNMNCYGKGPEWYYNC